MLRADHPAPSLRRPLPEAGKARFAGIFIVSAWAHAKFIAALTRIGMLQSQKSVAAFRRSPNGNLQHIPGLSGRIAMCARPVWSSTLERGF
jgi:hypothetical protein